MVDRWSKLSDLQLKLGPIGGSGMKVHGANAVVVENLGAEVGGKGEGYLEIALEQAEAARRELYEENGVLRGVMVRALNDVQGVLHLARSLVQSGEILDEVRSPSFIYSRDNDIVYNSQHHTRKQPSSRTRSPHPHPQKN
jgi:8-oxo-dGTP pyrophosphatase MutT (NUDIX family)